MSDYLKLNKTNWDERAPLHAASADYAVQRFVDDGDYLSDVVQFDRPLLGDIRGLRGVHLQCHIGTDTLSLARLGAQMSGVDFSPASLAEARALAQRCKTPIDYHESDVFLAAEVLPQGSFDLVYTGIGALCWLPSIERWARTVGALLKPGGRLFIREGHPMLWALNEDHQDSLRVEYPYFEHSEPLVWDDENTYVDTDSPLKATVTHEWNHGLGEIISALLAQGLEITGLVEHQSLPWEALPGQMEMDEHGEWRLKEAPWRLPLSYTLQAVKRRT
nr:class I SAM-dependent methyltransferase [Pseudomonas sp. FFPRI_1]